MLKKFKIHHIFNNKVIKSNYYINFKNNSKNVTISDGLNIINYRIEKISNINFNKCKCNLNCCNCNSILINGILSKPCCTIAENENFICLKPKPDKPIITNQISINLHENEFIHYYNEYVAL